MGIDTTPDLWYIINKSLHGLFCKNVHISVNRVTFNKVAFLFALHWASRHAHSRRRVRDVPIDVTLARQDCRHVRGLVAVVRILIATPRPSHDLMSA